jgi:hypothetical protein
MGRQAYDQEIAVIGVIRIRPAAAVSYATVVFQH